MGTLTAVPMAWALARGGDAVFVLGTLFTSVIGIFAASAFQRAHGTDDDQRIVIDEVAGYFVTLLLVPRSGAALLLAFVLFRLFDIWKPFPIRLIDRRVGGGFGVMADDLVAGVFAGLILFGLARAGIVARVAALLPEMLS